MIVIISISYSGYYGDTMVIVNQKGDDINVYELPIIITGTNMVYY